MTPFASGGELSTAGGTPAQGTIPIACDIAAIPAAERSQHAARIADWRCRIQESVELADGFSFRFTPDTPLLLTLAEFIARERLCCPFFRFQIELEPGGPLWLRLSGPAGVKDFLRTAFGTG